MLQVCCSPDGQAGRRRTHNRFLFNRREARYVVSPPKESFSRPSGYATASAYSASKFAIRGLTQSAGACIAV